MSDRASSGDLQSRVQQLERVNRFEADLRELALSVNRSLSSTLNLPASLATLCHAAVSLFGAHRASAWMHDRRARELSLEASSDPVYPETTRIPIVPGTNPYISALRRDAPEFVTLHGVRALAIPLRGRRRALGLLLLERLADIGVPTPRLLDGAAELGRQLSITIENTILIEDIVRSRRELENTFNSLADLVVVCDRNLRVVNANHAFVERHAGSGLYAIDRRVTELVGAPLGEWLTGLDLAANWTAPAAREFEDPVLGGHFSVRVTPLHGADRLIHGIVIVARDQSDQVKLQAEQTALRERLAQSQKLAALGQFVAGVAHELNNPLQGLLGHLELLRTTGRLPRELQAEWRVVYREAERAARIVNNLLVFTGRRRGARRPLSLNAVVTRTAALRARIAKRNGVAIIRELDRRLPRVRGDAALLQQALLNIIVNAEDAIASEGPGRGEIHLTTRRERRGGSTLAIVDVRDTGPGVRPDALPRIFEPFYTTKDVGKGTGLGLALAYGIVQDHGGEISASNERAGGAVFRIALPADTMEGRRTAHHD